MENLEVIVKKQIDQLSSVELTPDLIDRIDIGQLAHKAKQIVDALNKSNGNLDDLLNQGWFKSLLGSFGKNDKVLANAEKSLVDSAKFNVGLSCLLVLFSKAIKNQQDVIVGQQNRLQEHQERLEHQQDDILKIQGLTKEQADKIVQLLQADEYVKKLVEDAKSEFASEVSSLRNIIESRVVQFEKSLDARVNTVRAESSEALRVSAEALEQQIAKVSENAINQHNSLSAEVTQVSKSILSLQAEFTKRLRWSFTVSGVLAITLILKLVGII
jgi:hypothetical protein